jgi:hypothetical protein
MNLMSSEWEYSLKYADQICAELKKIGFNVMAETYTGHNRSKGIYLHVLNHNNMIYKSYATGIYSNVPELKATIEVLSRRIMRECY